MSENKLLSPRNCTKTRNAILRIKNCSPKLRTVLRERCKERIQSSRGEILGKLRGVTMPDNARNILSNILVEEWMDIDSKSDDLKDQLQIPECSKNIIEFDLNLALENIVEQELLSQNEEWLQEYESMLSSDIFNSNSTVCPLCCLGHFHVKYNLIECDKCGIAFPGRKTLENLHNDMYANLEAHNKNCRSDPSFAVIPDNGFENSLYVLCHECTFLNIVI